MRREVWLTGLRGQLSLAASTEAQLSLGHLGHTGEAPCKRHSESEYGHPGSVPGPSPGHQLVLLFRLCLIMA